MSKKMFTYAGAGVDVDVEEVAAKILFEAARQSWVNRQGRLGEVITPFEDFSGLRAINVGGLPEGTVMGIGFDGVGTKAEIAERMGKYDTIAFDLLAMVCDDAVVRGGEPVVVGSVLDVNTVGTGDETNVDQIRQLAQGYTAAAKTADVAIINGELAQLGDKVGGFGKFNYSWSAAVIWFAKKEQMLTGDEVRAGDKLVGLRETGFRSNGLSLVRKVLANKHGDNWHQKQFQDKSLGELVLTQSQIYCRAVVAMNELKLLTGVAHITGGGLPGKVGRLLKASGLGADITDPFDAPDIMNYAQKLGEVSEKEAYRTWNMGQGMVVATRGTEKVIELAEKYQIEAKVIGEVVSEPGVRLKDLKF